MEEGSEFPQWEIFANSFRLLFRHAGAALRLSILPFLMILALDRFLAMVWPDEPGESVWQIFYAAAYAVPTTLLLVPWYRLILAERHPELAATPDRGWYLAFLGRTMILELAMTLALLPSHVLRLMALAQDMDEQLARLSAILFLIIVPALYFYARAALALPAAAAGDDYRFGRWWRESEAIGWRLALVIISIGFIFYVVSSLFLAPENLDELRSPPQFHQSVIHAGIAILSELLIAAALAQAWLHLSDNRRAL